MTGFLFISLLAGLLTVLAPCVLPLLPVIIGGSVAGAFSTRRAGTIAISLSASIFIFTLLLKATTALIAVPELFWQIFSGGLLLLFGVATLFPSVWERSPGVNVLYRKSNQALGVGYQKKGLWGDIIIGAALGPVFSSCSPTYFVILAAVLPAHFGTGILYLFVYCLGLCFSLFVVALAGQNIATRLGWASTNKWFGRVIGCLFIVVGVGILFGLDKTIEAALPQSAFGEVGLEQKLLSLTSPSASSTVNMEDSGMYPKAPELAGIAGYINTNGQPITLSQYIGKDVVLVDFWDYSCINCQRSIPYVEAWYQKYQGEGLVIVGVHTPEFAFEQQQSNVQAAVTAAGITYPVVLDNSYDTWNAFQNEYWPAEYLIDKNGDIIKEDFGEGDYAQMEQAIQQALGVSTSTVSIPGQDLNQIQSPETYFGSNRNEYLGNGQQGVAGTQTLTLPSADSIQMNTLYLGGTWDFSGEYAEGGVGAHVEYQYDAHNIYMVAAPDGGPVTLEITLDGKPDGTVTIDSDKLYPLVQMQAAGVHTIQLQVESGKLQAYTFTFG